MSHPDETPQVRRCNDCRKWYDSSLRECPSCESPRPKFNKSLRTAQLNNHLYGMVANAQKEVALERRLAGRRPGVSSPLDRRPDSFIGR